MFFFCACLLRAVRTRTLHSSTFLSNSGTGDVCFVSMLSIVSWAPAWVSVLSMLLSNRRFVSSIGTTWTVTDRSFRTHLFSNGLRLAWPLRWTLFSLILSRSYFEQMTCLSCSSASSFLWSLYCVNLAICGDGANAIHISVNEAVICPRFELRTIQGLEPVVLELNLWPASCY